MGNSPVIRLVGTKYRKEKEEAMNIWHITHHTPLALRGPATGNERYQLVDDDTAYPKCVTIYEYESEPSLKSYLASPLHDEALEDLRRSWPDKDDYAAVWLVNYRRIARRGDDGYSRAFKLVGTDCPRNANEDEFNNWYTNEHLVSVLRSPLVIRVERYQRIGDDTIYPQYLAIYRYATERDLLDDRNSQMNRLAVAERHERWPDEVWQRRWFASYRMIAKQKKDLIVY